MRKKTMNNLGIEVSNLGFGCMRFPTTEDGVIDRMQAEAMLDEAMANGVTYYDTAYPYHNGESEIVVGEILNKYERSSYYLATKLPIWSVEKQEDVRKYLEEQLAKLQKDYIDFYLIHAMNRERLETVKKCNVLEELVKLREEGKIRYIGFSFHDEYAAFEEIINHFDWDFCQIQYNYMDTDEQAGDKGIRLAEEKGIPMVIMEPVRGGSLAKFSEDIESIFKTARPDKSIASWAFRWVAGHSNCKVILSGMSSQEQVR
ncbi:MAG: aldo/keto reductase, partial [Blautia sp.]|nr:aldo/keto reductase [Blautia sp.]